MECIMDVETFIYDTKKGSTKELDQLIKVLTDSKASDDVLIQCLGSIKDCVTLLDEDHEFLVGAILKVDWASRGPDFCTVYASLICSLVSVHTDYVKAVLRMIIKQFRPAVKGDVTDEVMGKDIRCFQNLHSLMHQILLLVPMSSTMVMPLLIDLYPYLNKQVYIQSCYLQNLFGIIHYLPPLRQQILELVIDKLMKMDVQLPKEEIVRGLEEEAIDEESGVFNMEEEKPKLVAGETLDILMTRLFEYIESVCFNQGALDWDATKRLYREMLFIFEKIILTTHGSNHVQFVFFYFCSLKSEICDGFLDFLWKLVQNPHIQAIFRQYAVLYIGSLLARGKFVSIATVMNTIDLMVSWLHSYTKMSSDSVMANYKYHGPFYSVCQSVFYVFAFRQKEIFNLKKGLKWAGSLQFQHLIQSRLNPLKFCLPIIVDTFASITRQHQLAFCDHIIQQNKRHILSNIGTQVVIESFFPFDPYLLEKSAVFIKKNYRDYDQSVHIGDGDSSDDDDDDDNDDEDIFSDEGMMTGATDNSLTKSMLDIMEYGTSPGFSKVKHKS